MFCAIRCLFGNARLRLDDGLGDVALPFLGHAAEIGLVADFVVDVVEVLQGLDDPLHHGILHGQQTAVLERVDVGPRNRADAVDVVAGVHRAEVPHGILIERAEQDHFDDDTPFARLGDELGQPLEVLAVPLGQVEVVAAVGIARACRCGPTGQSRLPWAGASVFLSILKAPTGSQ